MLAGVDFEYLNLIQSHFPDIWESLGFDIPHFTNVHFSGFVQAQYNLLNLFEFTLSGRIDYDQQYGVVPTPRAAIVITPGAGFYAKALYGNAFKAPSFTDLYFFRKNESYGNPSLKPESVHTFEVQLGWYRRRLMAISINGYFSMFQNLISFVPQTPGTPLKGYDTPDKQRYLPADQRPDSNASYIQKQNNASLTTYGGEFELRLFPVKGLHVFANFGVYFGQDNEGNQLTFAANWTGSLRASYRYQWFRIAVGALVVGPKSIPARAFGMPGGLLPPADTNLDRSTPVPSWSINNDPTTEAPMYIDTFASIQFLNILRHLDIIIRVNNVLNANIYDANDILLTPRKKLELMAWFRLHY
jgi:outer membrane receptor protein involved in Fe transport